jgi:hypothetical protein
MIFVIEVSNKLEKIGFGKKQISSIRCSHLQKTCLPCNSSKISFHIWIFKNWIYTMHNNVHMLSSPYIYIMGSHLDQSCMSHYLPCKTMSICWVHTMSGKYHILRIFIGSSFQNRFWELNYFFSIFIRKPISNILKGYQIHYKNISPVFWGCQICNQTISIIYSS